MLKRKSFVIVEGAAITVQHHRRAGTAGAFINVIMLRTPQLEELGSVDCFAKSAEDSQESLVAVFSQRCDIGTIALADGFAQL